MTISEISAVVEVMHAAYCESLGAAMPLTLGRRSCWERLVVEGYTSDDLKVVLARWTRQIRNNGMNVGVLRFSRITDVETFADDLVLARAEKKILGPTPKEKALRELRPQACEPVNTKTAQHGRDVALKALEKLRGELGVN